MIGVNRAVNLIGNTHMEVEAKAEAAAGTVH